MNVKWIVLLLTALWCVPAAHSGILRRGTVQLMCHRTANRDLPENTLESLALAARMGCNIIEVDITRTLDGQLVLNHDNLLDRFTTSTGDVEHTELRELDRMDFGRWRGERFAGMRIAHFDDALRLARNMNVNLYLDIKTKGIGAQLLAEIAREGMTERVMFGGAWDDIHAMDPHGNEDLTAGLQPGFAQKEVTTLQAEGKFVIANFLSNGHETDLPAMRSAVEAGVDAIMVDYPRLGAEAVGRPVEATIARLTSQAEHGSATVRVQAIRDLEAFVGFPLQSHFMRWLLDSDESISHEAALALLTSRPSTKMEALRLASKASAASARRNAAWAIGSIAEESSDSENCVPLLLPMLDDSDASVVREALMALTWCPAPARQIVPADKLKTFLSSPVPIVRGMAAVALAKYQPTLAAKLIGQQLEIEESEAAQYDAEWASRGRQKLTQPEIDRLTELYRAQMKYIQALATLPTQAALGPLASQAFRSVHDYSNVAALVAGYQLWDRLSDDPLPALHALSASDPEVADRAEWALVEAGPNVLSMVHKTLVESTGDSRQRLIRIVAWQADEEALPLLRQLEKTDIQNRELIAWAISKIETMRIH